MTTELAKASGDCAGEVAYFDELGAFSLKSVTAPSNAIYICKRQNNRVGTRKLPDFSNRFLRKVREFSYSSSSENADGSMSIIGSSAILAAPFAASGFSLMSAGTDSDHGISESR